LPGTGVDRLAGLVGDGIASGKTGAIQLDAQTFAMLQQDLGHARPNQDEQAHEEIKALEEEAAKYEAMAAELREKSAHLRSRLGSDAPPPREPVPMPKRSLAAKMESMRKERGVADEEAARAEVKADAKAVAAALMGGSLPSIDVSMEAGAMDAEPSVEPPARNELLDDLDDDDDDAWASSAGDIDLPGQEEPLDDVADDVADDDFDLDHSFSSGAASSDIEEDELISPDLLKAAMADGSDEGEGEGASDSPEDDIEDMLSEMNLLVDISVDGQIESSGSGAAENEMGSADLMETRVQDEVMAALSVDDLDVEDPLDALESSESDVFQEEAGEMSIPSPDKMRIALVVGQERARQRLKKRLAEFVGTIEEAASLPDAVEMASEGGLHAMVVVRPAADEKTLRSITSMSKMKKRPGLMILATDEKLAGEEGVDMHVVLAQRASEVTRQILDGLASLADRG
jgi:hypothetical protein